jgi:hypothetical protein
VIMAGARARALSRDPARAASLADKTRLLAAIALETAGRVRP